MIYRDVLAFLQPHFGGSGTTSTEGSIAPELRPLYESSAQALMGQQEANDIGQYNEAHPMGVAGANPLQQFGASMMMGGNLPTNLDALALQGINRQTGLAGAGPTTGQYDYEAEAGLGDMKNFMNPTTGYVNGEDGFAFPRSDQTGDLPNMAPSGAPNAPNYDLSDVLAPPPGGGGGQGGFQLPTGNYGSDPSAPGGGTLPGGRPGQTGAFPDLQGSDGGGQRMSDIFGGGGFRGTPEQQAAAASSAARNGPHSPNAGPGGREMMSSDALSAELAKYGVSMGAGEGGWGNFSGKTGKNFQMTGAMHEGASGRFHGPGHPQSGNDPMGNWLEDNGVPQGLAREMAYAGSKNTMDRRTGVTPEAARLRDVTIYNQQTAQNKAVPKKSAEEKAATVAANTAAAEKIRAGYK